MGFKLSELFGRKKKYPFNKKNPPAAVYAGPEYFARRSGQKRDEGEVVDVYAGPESFTRRAPRNDGNGRIYAGPERSDDCDVDVEIYAGPEYYERQAPQGPEEDAPLPPEDEEKYNTVYAGPEPPAEGEADAPAKKPGLLVYAGPEFFARKADKAPDAALAVGVYAGPEPPRVGMMGMMGGASPTPPEDEGKADGEA